MGLERIVEIVRDIYNWPKKQIEKLDPPGGHGPEDLGDIGAMGKRIGEKLRDNPDEIRYS